MGFKKGHMLNIKKFLHYDNNGNIINKLQRLPEKYKGYIAGIIDGEGTIGLYPYSKARRGYRPHLVVAMNHKRTIQLLHRILGCGTVEKLPIRNLAYGQTFRYNIRTLADIYLVLNVITPYLCTKRLQGTLIQRYCLLKLNGNMTDKVGKTIWKRFRYLNKRGA